MKKIFFIVGIVSIVFLGSCVESSQKYKSLQAKYDSLNTIAANQNAEMETLYAGLNEIAAGMQSLREAEQLLALETSKDNKVNSTKEQIASLKNDIRDMSNAIISYKEQIAKLEKQNKRQSAEFKKLIAGLNEELEKRNTKIAEISNLLAEREKELGIKTQQIAELNRNVENLQKESTGQKMTISQQDQAIHTAHYLLGSRKALKETKVISRQGIFCPPIVSAQAQNANFVDIDVREMKSLPLNTKKAKILSVHPAESYTIETADDGMQTLKINDENSFWKQTKYLVVMISE